MYSNLPASSKFAKFLACSIALVGMILSGRDPEQRMQTLRELNPDLAFEVGLCCAVKVDVHKASKVDVDISEHLPNACLFHDHTSLSEAECRKRIASKPHVFTTILDACAKLVMVTSTRVDD